MGARAAALQASSRQASAATLSGRWGCLNHMPLTSALCFAASARSTTLITVQWQSPWGHAPLARPVAVKAACRAVRTYYRTAACIPCATTQCGVTFTCVLGPACPHNHLCCCCCCLAVGPLLRCRQRVCTQECHIMAVHPSFPNTKRHRLWFCSYGCSSSSSNIWCRLGVSCSQPEG